jgi:hypothetical protein
MRKRLKNNSVFQENGLLLNTPAASIQTPVNLSRNESLLLAASHIFSFSLSGNLPGEIMEGGMA